MCNSFLHNLQENYHLKLSKNVLDEREGGKRSPSEETDLRANGYLKRVQRKEGGDGKRKKKRSATA